MLALIVIFIIFNLMHGEAIAAAERSTVAVIASDMPHLTAPTSRDSVPTDQAIEAMVREAMELGGIRDVLQPDARHVLLKPCIVVAKRDPERNTDPRAVRAVAMKNQVGVAPGMKYGWPKKTGYPSGSGNPGLPHSNEVLGEMITDLKQCSQTSWYQGLDQTTPAAARLLLSRADAGNRSEDGSEVDGPQGSEDDAPLCPRFP